MANKRIRSGVPLSASIPEWDLPLLAATSAFDNFAPVYATSGPMAAHGPNSMNHFSHFNQNSYQTLYQQTDNRGALLPAPITAPSFPTTFEYPWSTAHPLTPRAFTAGLIPVQMSGSMLPGAEAEENRIRNTKVEIPQNQTLGNLDSLIAGARTEEQTLTFKKHKRLLKNREAALQSRQRRKVQMEALEADNRRLLHVVNQLEGRLDAAERRIQAQDEEIARLRAQGQASQGIVRFGQLSPSHIVAAPTRRANFGDDLNIAPVYSAAWR